METQSQSQLKHSTITAPDGGSLSYYSIGQGPGLIILHGAMTHAQSHRELAGLLAPFYTVYLLSRRGHGLSSPFPRSVTSIKAVAQAAEGNDEAKDQEINVGGVVRQRTYNPKFCTAVVETELGDLNLLIKKTQAKYILGESSGAVLSMAACLQSGSMPGIQKIVIFEPPLQLTEMDTGLDIKGLGKYEAE